MLDRRELLLRAGGLAIAGGALGSLAAPARAATAPVSALRRELQGDLVARGGSGYAQAKLVYNNRFNGTNPLAIAYCESATDVAKALRWAERYEVPLAARSGGHSYGGYSTTGGLVIDVSRLNGVRLAGGIATVGAGAQLIDIYSDALESPTHDPRRLVPDGRHRRAHARRRRRVQLASARDDLGQRGRRSRSSTPSGSVRTCTANENSDLYWACRGGGGGNFGVVTSFRFKTYPVDDGHDLHRQLALE